MEPMALSPDLVTGDDGLARCRWAGSTADYAVYHDEEWGRVLHGDDALFERLVLEGFQSGLAWITILRKREAFRKAYEGFHIATVAAYDEEDVERLLGDAGIVRSRAKIKSSINNARVAAELEGGLDAFLWSYAPKPRPKSRRPRSFADVPAVTDESAALAKALKKLGMSFVGPTTAYAMMQATGMVDDHLVGCHRASTV
jgi:DNA-3-methyladenine glycosylase I